eukprot:gnl/TRDRNA2_/TRDRNA2_60960_c0_seq1.p1 gnl/TRDRNA2_/TRDRNA2_60960_c0~~gnl/TRDRNA2_/TRDRNA2_60960_c0_seq1.p1  ORF type:complete len:649 (+),score=90.90 gnl/TRDRNA2_/TRDRNA2_60960_c0_seq1:74-1948(+)
MPAFHDAHCHPFGAGNRQRQSSWSPKGRVAEDAAFRSSAVDLSGCTKWIEVEQRILDAVKAGQVADEVVLAEHCPLEALSGTDRSKVADRLDKLVPGRPVVVLLGGSADSPLPPEGVIASAAAMAALPATCSSWVTSGSESATGVEQTGSGTPTGYLHGAVWAARCALLSSASVASKGLRGLMDGLRELPKDGIVACTDAFVFEDRVPSYEAAYAGEAGHLLPRTSLAMGFREGQSSERLKEALARVAALRRSWEQANFRYCLREAKVEVDHAPWSTKRQSSAAAWDLEQLGLVVHAMVRKDFSIHAHVFGDLAAKHMIRLFSEAEAGDKLSPARTGLRRKAAGSQALLGKDATVDPEATGKLPPAPEIIAAVASPATGAMAQPTSAAVPTDAAAQAASPATSLLVASGDRRHKLAHVFSLLPEDTAKLCQVPQGVTVVYQPHWFSYSYDVQAQQTHGQLLAGQAAVCYGSDWDISELSPLQGIKAVLSLEGDGIFGVAVPWETRLACALRLYMLEAAHAMWLDEVSGTIEVGKLADLCVLDRDIFAMTEAAFKAEFDKPPAQVVATFSRGLCIFQQTDEEKVSLTRLKSRRTSGSSERQRGIVLRADDYLSTTCNCVNSICMS